VSDVVVRVTGLFYYPVKSCRGIAVDAVTLDRRGIVDDRRLMIVDEWGRFVSQRSHRLLALVEARLDGDSLSLSAPNMSPLTISVAKQGSTKTVTIWYDECESVDQGRDAAAWFSELLAAPMSLVRMSDSFVRGVDAQYAVRSTDQVGFADGYPLLVISEESLDDLNSRLERPVAMNRFRPNIVVRGGGAFAEDRWRRVRFGEVTAAIVKPCARCSTTTVDQDTAVRGKEPLRTLAGYRYDPERDVLFGQNVIHSSAGTIRVGDVVETARR
jgi:uncharacterized protein YcbX